MTLSTPGSIRLRVSDVTYGNSQVVHSIYFFAAQITDVLNPALSSAPSVVQFQNLVSFHPWLGMGATPGRTWGKGLGTKLRSLDDLPAGARKAFELRTPEIFDLPSWTLPRIDFAEYMQKRG